MPRGGDVTNRQFDSLQHGDDDTAVHGWLRVFAGPPGGAAVRIPAHGATLGRAANPAQADVQLDDGRTSRLHARLAFDEEAGWRLTDLGSRNGGFVDGAVLAPSRSAAIVHGSVIRLGDTVAVFASEAADPDDATDVDFFPGVSALAHRLRQRIRLLARSSGHLLVVGETGTGKERVVRRIGDEAPPLVPINCAELSRELARGELFGHARGAFTGATGARDGLIETARSGVVFLDEIGELPLDVQGELLRFLEDGSYRPLGSSELRVSRARIVAATNVDLDEAVRLGRFRRDLLARLRASSQPLALPPLRERREDLPGWVERFVREVVADAPAQPWNAGTLEGLLLYPWPENLRELRGAVRGALEPPRAWPIHPSRLPTRLQDHRRGLRTLHAGADGPPPDDDVRADAPTRAQIEAALTQTGGRMRTTAELLGIDRRRLYRLCEKLDVDPGRFRRGE